MDFFRPRTDPAMTIYDAFQSEAAKRDGRAWPDWNNYEIAAVYLAAVKYAAANGLAAPTFQQVVAAERTAEGSADYGAKWAYRVAEHMTPVKQKG